MVERVFLTDTRRAVLEGDFNGPDATKRSHKSRIRTRARMALHELIEVAHSSEIDNADIFDPAEVRALIEALLGPRTEIKPFHEAFGEGTEARQNHFETYAYERQLIEQIGHMNTLYSSQLLSINPPQSVENEVLIEKEDTEE